MQVIRETGFVVQRELRRNFRSVRGIALYALTMLGGLVAALVGSKVSEWQGQVLDEYGHRVTKEGALYAWTLLYRNDGIVAERLANAPTSLVVTAWTSVWLCPLLVGLVGFDSISAERQHRTLRYFITRTRRGSYFAGKWLGLWATTALVLLGVQLVAWICSVAIVHDAPGEVLKWGPVMYLVTLPILGTWCAVATLISSLVKTPMIALLLIFGTFTVMWLLGNIGSETTSQYLAFAYPGSFDHFLLRPTAKHFGIGLAACAAYPILFIGGGSFLFARSEV